MSEALDALKSRLADVLRLGQASALLDWDQQTYMPRGAVEARAEQKATLSKLHHELFTAEETGTLLQRAEGEDAEGQGAALLRVVRRDYDQATKLPTELVTEITRVTSVAQEEWAKARAADDYPAFAPWLEKIVDLQRRVAQSLGYKGRMYDALLDQYEPGASTAQIDQIFAGLKAELIPLSRAIFARLDRVSDAPIHGEFDENAQREFAESVLRDCGFDFDRGRQDRSVHPFCTNFGRDDVRLTTRYDRSFLPMALFGSLHEMGHGLYEQGSGAELEGTSLAGGASLGIHESQSRMWENLVGRSRPFWRHYFPKIQGVFPSLQSTDLEGFYRAINRVDRSLIRVEADEVTYNLHIILRYELENDLLEGRLSVADAPEAWNAKMREYLDLTPPTNREGILQDVHWSIGILGYFPTYSLGNLVSVQLFEAAKKAVSGLEDGFARGEFAPLLGWLRENVHQYGRTYLPDELIRKATGQPLSPEPYMRYLKGKFGEIYGV